MIDAYDQTYSTRIGLNFATNVQELKDHTTLIDLQRTIDLPYLYRDECNQSMIGPTKVSSLDNHNKQQDAPVSVSSAMFALSWVLKFVMVLRPPMLVEEVCWA